MNRIQIFEEEQAELYKKKVELDKASRLEQYTLTEDEQKRLEELKHQYSIGNDNKMVTMVTTTNGSSSETSIKEYFRMVDDNMETTKNGLKLVNASDNNLLDSATSLVNSIQDIIYEQIQNMTVNDDGEVVSKDILETISNDINNLCINELKISNVDSDGINKYFSNYTITALKNILPKSFVETFIDSGLLISENAADDRDRIINIIGMMVMSKNEIGRINEYIEYSEKVMQVLIRLEECGKDLSEALKNPQTFSEAVERTRAETGNPKINELVMKYKSHFKDSNISINAGADYFAIRYVMMQELAKAYEKFKVEYSDKDELEAIDNEISESRRKSECYLDACQLETFAQVYSAYEFAAKSDKRTSRKGLNNQGKTYIDKVRKSKLNLSFPGYQATMKNSNEIFISYKQYIDSAVKKYNEMIDSAENCNITDLKKINCDTEVLAGVLLTIMARLLKKFTKNTSDKFNAISITSYYQRFSRIGTDLFTIWEMYKIVEPIVKYIESK